MILSPPGDLHMHVSCSGPWRWMRTLRKSRAIAAALSKLGAKNNDRPLNSPEAIAKMKFGYEGSTMKRLMIQLFLLNWNCTWKLMFWRSLKTNEDFLKSWECNHFRFVFESLIFLGWWFHILFLMFTSIWGKIPFWRAYFFRWVELYQPVFSLGCGVPKVHLAAGPVTRQAIIEKEGVEVRNPSLCFFFWVESGPGG